MSSVFEKSIEENLGSVIETVKVKTMSVNNVLDKAKDHISFLSIDLEGLDEEILYRIDLERYKPEVICSETRGANSKLISYMKEKGYKYVYSNGQNDIWCR